MMQYIIYCDESASKGKYYSNFYGGVLLSSIHLNHIENSLNQLKGELNLHGEIKWSKMTEAYLNKYTQVVDAFFGFVAEGKIKTRIMFSDNRFVAPIMPREYIDNKYFILYYHFIKMAFGLEYADLHQGQPTKVRILLDALPDTKEKAFQFKNYLVSLSKNVDMRNNNLMFGFDEISEVNSHKHVILQCLDIVLGSMNFRLNDFHKIKPAGSFRRSKRTIAKEKLYEHINKRIREIYPHFNIGRSTGFQGDSQNRWKHAYRHWVFISRNSTIDDAAPTKQAP